MKVLCEVKKFAVCCALVHFFYTGCSQQTVGPNRAPVSYAGLDQNIMLPATVDLDGSGSYDPERDPLTYRWSVVARPSGSTAEIMSVETIPVATMIPDLPGIWVIELVVHDGQQDSNADIVKISVQAPECENDQQCDDGLWCNGTERCIEKSCQPGEPPCTQPTEPCIMVVCNEPQKSCIQTEREDGEPCADNLWCTVDEQCQAGVCTGTDRCEASTPCMQVNCNEEQLRCERTTTPNGIACEDGLYCSVGEICIDGKCRSGQPRDCSMTSAACLVGICDEQSGSCIGVPLSPGAACDDGDACTLDDSCDGAGVCTGQPLDCSHLDSACHKGVCNPLSSACEPINLDQISCDDGDICTIGDRCDQGQCVAGAEQLDADSDGFIDHKCGGADCDDQKPDVNPNAIEGPVDALVCFDGIDNNCDGVSDEDAPDCKEWLGKFAHRRKLSFDNRDLGMQLNGFVALVKLNKQRIDYQSNDGHDVQFVDADNQTILNHEIEKWDSAGESFIWVRVPQIDADVDTDFIWMYYNNDNSVAQDPVQVWKGYLAVWHLDEVANDSETVAIFKDSTGQNHGHQHGNNAVDGLVAGGQFFDGADDYIEVDPAGLAYEGNTITITALIYVEGEPNGYGHIVGAGGVLSAGRYWQFWWQKSKTIGGRLRIDGDDSGLFPNDPARIQQWHFAAIRYDGSEATVLLDAEPIASRSINGSLDPISTAFHIGDNPAQEDRNFNGIIDEVRISNKARSNRRLQAEMRSLSDSFITFGPQESR